MSERIVYHTSSHQGIETFCPKPYWHSPDFSASGVVEADTQIPEGAVRKNLFFAQGSERMWYWFSPKDVIKSMLPLGSLVMSDARCNFRRTARLDVLSSMSVNKTV